MSVSFRRGYTGLVWFKCRRFAIAGADVTRCNSREQRVFGNGLKNYFVCTDRFNLIDVFLWMCDQFGPLLRYVNAVAILGRTELSIREVRSVYMNLVA